MSSIIQSFLTKMKDRLPRHASAKPKKQFIAKDHPAFGMWADDPRSVEEIMAELRQPRYSDLWHEFLIDSEDD